MTKKLLPLAVAAAMVVPGAAMAEAILYGKVHMAIDYIDTQDGFDGFKLDSTRGASRFGLKGSEDLGYGLKAIYQMEFGVQMTEDDMERGKPATGSDNTLAMRNSFIGLAGDWGTFLVGRHDSPYKDSADLDLFADTIADRGDTLGFDDVRLDNAIAYISPNLSGFTFALATHVGGGQSISEGTNLNSDSLAEGYSVAGIYENGPFYASLAYESFGNELYMNTETSEKGKCLPLASTCSYVDDDYTKWRAGLGLLDWNGFSLTAAYEEQSDRPGSAIYTTDGTVRKYGSFEKLKIWEVNAGYSFGNSTVMAKYGSGDRSGDLSGIRNAIEDVDLKELKDSLQGDYYSWALGFSHDLSKRTNAYIVYTQVDDDWDANDWDGFSIGMVHKF